MARQVANVIQNNFIRGLITEITTIKFPEDAATETWNCVFDETGRVTRRPGIDFETSSETSDRNEDADATYIEFVWESVGGDGDVSFLVIQRGKILEFYDLSASVDSVSAERKNFSVDLTAYKPSGSGEDVALHPCAFAFGNGVLVVSSKAVNPFYIEYDADQDAITVNNITVQERDFDGVDDETDTNERVSSSVAGIIVSNPKKYYNLLNQGWAISDALSQWDTARTDLPSNADTVALYRSSATDAFDNTLVTSKGPGTSRAPRGHFILDAFAPSRNTAASDEGFTLDLTFDEADVDYTGATVIGDFTNPTNAFDENAGTYANFTGTGTKYAGITHASTSSVYRAYIDGQATAVDVTFYLYGKTGSAPASATNGTLLGSTTISITDTSPTTYSTYINSSDTLTAWSHLWVTATTVRGNPSATPELRMSEVVLTSATTGVSEGVKTYLRPRALAFYSGRIWYAGIDAPRLGNTLLFSQIVRENEQLGMCYQSNDPTHEDFFDLLPSDGGTVTIPEIATIIRLEIFQTSLLIFATNGVWEISGGGRNSFAADDYSVRKISGIGSNSPHSFIKYKGLPIWWGDSGIYALSYDPQFGSFSVQSLTDQTIFSFINDIPVYSRNFVKGVYNLNDDIAIFLYNDGSLTDTTKYTYTKALCFNGLSKAFYPWEFETFSGSPTIRGLVYAVSPTRSETPRIKYIVENTASSSTNLTFAEVSDVTNWRDWFSLNNSGEDGKEYSSYFTAGHMLHGQLQRFAQPNYVFVFLEQETNASCYMQGVFEWTTSSASNRWSNPQQIYNSSLTNRSTNFRRLKVRGKGRSIQLKFYSEDGKPFTIIGWSIKESINADI